MPLNDIPNDDSPSTFWVSLLDSYPILSKKALFILIPFVTTYLCESGFSTLVNIKTKKRPRLLVEHDIRVALSTTTPCIKKLAKKKQEQGYH